MVAGGATSMADGSARAAVWVWNPAAPAAATATGGKAATNGWVKHSVMGVARDALTLVVCDDVLWALGGRDARGTPTDAVEWYDARRAVWCRAAPLPQPRVRPTVVVVESFL